MQLKAKRTTPAQGQSLVKAPTAKKAEAPKYKTWSQFAESLKEIK
jgi:hypothetical protein